MSTSEREALGLWCPFVRGAWGSRKEDGDWRTSGDPVGFNRAFVRPGSADLPIGRCVGSGCMAWRTTGLAEAGREVRLFGLSRREVSVVHERRGYCGLAGAPGLSDAEALR